MKIGDLMQSDACNVWNGPSNTGSGTIVGNTEHGDLVLILEIKDNDVKVLTAQGTVGWIDVVVGEKRKRLHEVR